MTEENIKQLEKVDTHESEENNTDNKDEVKGPIPAELLKGIPPEDRKIISSFMMRSSSMMGSMPNPIMDKITPEHIDKILENTGNFDQRVFEDHGKSRWFRLVYVIISVALFVFLTIYLVKSDKALYLEILKLAITFAGGLGGGFGIKAYIDRNR